jgi:hypothetical protein
MWTDDSAVRENVLLPDKIERFTPSYTKKNDAAEGMEPSKAEGRPA